MFAHVDKSLFKMPIPDISKFKRRLDGVKNYESLKDIIYQEKDNLFMGPKKIFKLRNKPASSNASDTSEKSVVTTSSRQVKISH